MKGPCILFSVIAICVVGLTLFIYGVAKLPEEYPKYNKDGTIATLAQQRQMHDEILVNSVEFKIMIAGLGLMAVSVCMMLIARICCERLIINDYPFVARVQQHAPVVPERVDVRPQTAALTVRRQPLRFIN